MNDRWRKGLFDFLLIAATLAVLYLGVRQFFFLIFPIALALVFSEAIRKSFARLSPISSGGKKILIILILLIFFALLSLVVILLTDRLIRTITFLSSWLSIHFDEMFSFCQEKVQAMEDFFSDFFKRDLQNSISANLPPLFRTLIQKILEKTPDWIGKVVNFVPRFFISLFIFLISTYYFSCDGDRFSNFFAEKIPPEKLERFRKMKALFFRTLAQYGKAYLLLFLLTFAQLFLGLVLIRVPGAAGKAFFIAFVDILPILGCGTVLIPWSLFCFLSRNTGLGIGILILYLIILVVRQIAEPKIVGSSIGLHPVLSLVLVLGGLYFFGFFGMFFFPLFAVCILHSVKE